MSFPAPRRLPWLLLLAAAVFAADRYTKTWVTAHVGIGSAIPVIHRVLRITHWTNDGAAFSMFADSASPQAVRWGLSAVGCVMVLAMLAALVRFGARLSRLTVALALILGGALGNLHDRIAYGSVVDFIEVHIFRYHWPDFNVADSAVVTGACLLLLDSLLPHRPADAPASADTHDMKGHGVRAEGMGRERTSPDRLRPEQTGTDRIGDV